MNDAEIQNMIDKARQIGGSSEIRQIRKLIYLDNKIKKAKVDHINKLLGFKK